MIFADELIQSINGVQADICNCTAEQLADHARERGVLKPDETLASEARD